MMMRIEEKKKKKEIKNRKQQQKSFNFKFEHFGFNKMLNIWTVLLLFLTNLLFYFALCFHFFYFREVNNVISANEDKKTKEISVH